ncbi:hypothetical protein [Wolbachia endosymbiont (group A) of Lasioglossum morio]|uniref:hypothetical protein n=1 Tax=Wolbachia endosymbiont (group A) of Lasioglossum morio TaxID=2954025 RepID=UPI00397DABC1
MRAISTANGVIPVLGTGIQPLLCSHLVEIKSSGSQCLGTGMTPFAVQFTFKNECSYSYGMNRGMTR